MIYDFYPKANYTLIMKERHSRSQIAYYSIRKMNELYPHDEYEVIGEIGCSIKRYSSQDIILIDTGKSIPIFPRGSLKKIFEWIVGYAAVGENTYVAVVKSVIPLFVW